MNLATLIKTRKEEFLTLFPCSHHVAKCHEYCRDEYLTFLEETIRITAEKTMEAIVPEQKMTLEEVAEANKDLPTPLSEHAYFESKGWIDCREETLNRYKNFSIEK